MRNGIWHMKMPELTEDEIEITKRVLGDLKDKGYSHYCPWINYDCSRCEKLFPNLGKDRWGKTLCPCRSINYTTRFLINVLTHILRVQPKDPIAEAMAEVLNRKE